MTFQYEDLCEVFTDKLVAKIPSTASGVVKQINFSNDQICAVGHPILTIELDDGKQTETAPYATNQQSTQKASSQAAAATPSSSAQPAQTKKSENKLAVHDHDLDKSLSTPAVRYIAKKEGININDVPPTGKNGRVTKTDIINYISNGKQGKVLPQSASHSTNTSDSSDDESSARVHRHKIAPLTGIQDGDQ